MYRRWLLVLGAALLMVALGAGSAVADDPMRIVVKRIDADAFPKVRLVASVVDANGDPVAGLRTQDLQLRERNAATAVTVELASRTSPIALALVIDTSGSMSGRPLADAKAAVGTMIAALGTNDQLAVLSFNSAVRVVQPLTADKTRVAAAVSSLVAGGDTAIYDAMVTAAQVLESADANARRALILLTDGLDTASRTTSAQAAARLVSAALPLYAIALGDTTDRAALLALAHASAGGQLYVAPSSAQLPAIYGSLARPIVTEY